MTSRVDSFRLLVRMKVVVETSSPQTDVKEVVLLTIARLEPEVRAKCNDVTYNRQCHENNNDQNQQHTPNRQRHLVRISRRPIQSFQQLQIDR